MYLAAILHNDRFPPGGHVTSKPLVEGEPQFSLGGRVHLPDLLAVHLAGDPEDPRVQLHRLLVDEEEGRAVRLNQLESLVHHLAGWLLQHFYDLHNKRVHADLVLEDGCHH